MKDYTEPSHKALNLPGFSHAKVIPYIIVLIYQMGEKI